jgi:hypothetical protein
MTPTQHATPHVSVIIPARDAEPTLARTLAALAEQTLEAPYEVIVVDDGSSDRTSAIASAHAPLVQLVTLETSEGPGAARNRGVARASAPVLAFTDADCFPTPEWLAAGLRAIATGADIVQGQVLPDPGEPRTPFDRTVIVRGETGYYPTANLFVRRERFDALGGFRDWLLEHDRERGRVRRRPADRRRARATRTPIGEDTLFAWRARRAGAVTTYAPDALVHHAVVAGRLWDELLDRWHWASDMPGAVQLVPELRQAAFHRRWFFSARTAHFDLALASVLVAAVSRRRWPLIGAVPYGRWLYAEGGTFDRPAAVRHVLGTMVSDGATLAALLMGSAAWRCLLL